MVIKTITRDSLRVQVVSIQSHWRQNIKINNSKNENQLRQDLDSIVRIWPIRVQYSGHMIRSDQSEASCHLRLKQVQFFWMIDFEVFQVSSLGSLIWCGQKNWNPGTNETGFRNLNLKMSKLAPYLSKKIIFIMKLSKIEWLHF